VLEIWDISALGSVELNAEEGKTEMVEPGVKDCFTAGLFVGVFVRNVG
jgi:hypothetical protein